MRIQNLTAALCAVLLCLAAARPGAAQIYTGGNGTGMPGTIRNGVYTPPKGGYKSSTGIAIGAVAAAGVGLTYFMLRSRGRLEGCVTSAGSGKQIITTKNQQAYTLITNGVSLPTGERVTVKGRKSKNSAGESEFTADKLVKDNGSCE